jgi:hypothetical protein
MTPTLLIQSLTLLLGISLLGAPLAAQHVTQARLL